LKDSLPLGDIKRPHGNRRGKLPLTLLNTPGKAGGKGIHQGEGPQLSTPRFPSPKGIVREEEIYELLGIRYGWKTPEEIVRMEQTRNSERETEEKSAVTKN